MEFTINKNTPKTKLNRHWQYCIGSGHAPMTLRTDYVKQLKKVHEELGIQYVRFHGIFNDDMQVLMKFSDLMSLPGAQKLETLSFRKIGLVYDNVLSCGMKPYVELSFMPKHLAASDEKCSFYYGGCISPPKDEEKWSLFIQKFVMYLIHRYGKEEVESWPFEVWNEPDVFVFWAGTKEQYFRLYEITAKAIKKINPDIKVGGPATSGSKWIASFMNYCKTHDVPVDFISTHQYAGDPIGGVNASDNLEEERNLTSESMAPLAMLHLLDGIEEGSVLDGLRCIMPDKSELVDISNKGFRENAKIVQKQAEGLPVYYSEWNENAIFSSYTNDTRKVASYIVKAALDTEKYVEGSSIWCFSDIFEEFSEIAEEFHGGFGLMTHTGIPKPQYYAMRILSQLADYRLDLGADATDGEVGIAAFRDNDQQQILLFRQKMKNSDLPKEHVIVLIEADYAPKEASLQRIDENHCNPLQGWENMGKPGEMLPSEIRKLTEETSLQLEKMEIQYRDGYIVIETDLGVNDIYLITI